MPSARADCERAIRATGRANCGPQSARPLSAIIIILNHNKSSARATRERFARLPSRANLQARQIARFCERAVRVTGRAHGGRRGSCEDARARSPARSNRKRESACFRGNRENARFGVFARLRARRRFCRPDHHALRCRLWLWLRLRGSMTKLFDTS